VSHRSQIPATAVNIRLPYGKRKKMSSIVVRSYLKRGIGVFKDPSLVVVIAILFIAVAPSAAQECPGATQEGWDGGDLNLWHGLAGTVVSAPITGGNPGGYLEAEKDADFLWFANGNPPWSGDWVAGEIRQILIEVNVLGGDGITGPSFQIRKDPMSNGWWFDNTGVIANDGQWHSFTAPISPDWSDAQAEAAGWAPADGIPPWSFSETLASVGTLSIMVSSVPPNHPVGFDNVEISCRIFADGFESGNTSAWTTAVGLHG
jgi:hypothetical protein